MVTTIWPLSVYWAILYVRTFELDFSDFFLFPPLPFRSKFKCSLEILYYAPLPLSFYGHWICNYWGPGTIINTLASQILHVCFILPKFLILVFIYCLDSYCLLAQVSASCSVQCPCTWRNASAIMTTQRMFSEWIHCALSLWTQLFHKPCSMPCIKASLQQQCQPEELTPHPPNPQTYASQLYLLGFPVLAHHVSSQYLPGALFFMHLFIHLFHS